MFFTYLIRVRIAQELEQSSLLDERHHAHKPAQVNVFPLHHLRRCENEIARLTMQQEEKQIPCSCEHMREIFRDHDRETQARRMRVSQRMNRTRRNNAKTFKETSKNRCGKEWIRPIKHAHQLTQTGPEEARLRNPITLCAVRCSRTLLNQQMQWWTKLLHN